MSRRRPLYQSAATRGRNLSAESHSRSRPQQSNHLLRRTHQPIALSQVVHKGRLRVLLTAIAFFSTAPAYSWDGAVSGEIGEVHSLPQAGNYDFRVTLRGQTGQWCGSTDVTATGWAGLHSNEHNFKGVQAALMLALAMRKTVTLYLTRDSNQLCKIGYVVVRD